MTNPYMYRGYGNGFFYVAQSIKADKTIFMYTCWVNKIFMFLKIYNYVYVQDCTG